MASRRCKNTGDSQINFKMPKALALRSTLSRICGLDAYFDTLVDEAPREVEAPAEPEVAGELMPNSESTSEAEFESFCCCCGGVASKGSAW